MGTSLQVVLLDAGPFFCQDAMNLFGFSVEACSWPGFYRDVSATLHRSYNLKSIIMASPRGILVVKFGFWVLVCALSSDTYFDTKNASCGGETIL